MTNIKSEQEGRSEAAVIHNQGRIARNAGMILVLCLIVLVIGILFIDDGYPSLSGAAKLVMKLVVIFLHML